MEIQSPEDLPHRKGHIELPLASLRDELPLIQRIMCGAVIVRAESVYMRDVMVYDLMHPEFRVIGMGEVAPTYDVEIDTDDESGEITEINFIERIG